MLISQLWTTYDSLWKARCDMLHDPDDVHSLSNIELNNRIRPFFTDPYRFLGTGDQHLLGGGLPATLNLFLVRKRQWLKVIDQRASIERKCHSALTTQQQSIRTYFS